MVTGSETGPRPRHVAVDSMQSCMSPSPLSAKRVTFFSDTVIYHCTGSGCKVRCACGCVKQYPMQSFSGSHGHLVTCFCVHRLLILGLRTKTTNKELGWKPSVTFEEGLSKTIDWYLSNKQWLENTTSGKYLEYYNKMYNHQ